MNPTTIAEMQAKAAELRAKYPGQSVIVEAQAWAHNYNPKSEPYVTWRIHVLADYEEGLDGEAITGAELDTIEAQIADALDPAKKQARALARAAAMEAEAAALRASVAGGAA